MGRSIFPVWIKQLFNRWGFLYDLTAVEVQLQCDSGVTWRITLDICGRIFNNFGLARRDEFRKLPVSSSITMLGQNPSPMLNPIYDVRVFNIYNRCMR